MEAINNVQTKDYIVNQIKNEIMSGNIKPGEELTQENIASLLGVSRMPVREAFQILAKEGVLIRLPNRHMQVANIRLENITTMFKVISSIEYIMIQEILENDLDLSPLLESYEKCKEYRDQGNYAAFAEEEIKMHKKLWTMVDNPYLFKMQDFLIDGYYSYARRLITTDEGILMSSMEMVPQIINGRSTEGFREKIDEYFLFLADYLINNLKEKYNE